MSTNSFLIGLMIYLFFHLFRSIAFRIIFTNEVFIFYLPSYSFLFYLFLLYFGGNIADSKLAAVDY